MIIYSKFLTEGTESEGLDLFYWNLGDLEVDVMSRFLKKVYTMELQVTKKITEVIKNNNVTQVGACYTLYVFIYLASSLSWLVRPTNL